MAWYAFHGYNNGKAISASTLDGAELNALGMHGYPTERQAEQHPNSVGWWQVVTVNAAIDDANNARDVASAPGNAAKAIANAAIPGAGNISADVINWFRQPALWTRLGEILAGVVILYVGLKAVATPGSEPVVRRTVKDTAKTVVKRAR